MSNKSEAVLEVHRWPDVGYQPLVFSAGWQVALLNWEPLLDPAYLGEIERHHETDEVFVLWRGHGALFVATGDNKVELTEMEPGGGHLQRSPGRLAQSGSYQRCLLDHCRKPQHASARYRNTSYDGT